MYMKSYAYSSWFQSYGQSVCMCTVYICMGLSSACDILLIDTFQCVLFPVMFLIQARFSLSLAISMFIHDSRGARMKQRQIQHWVTVVYLMFLLWLSVSASWRDTTETLGFIKIKYSAQKRNSDPADLVLLTRYTAESSVLPWVWEDDFTLMSGQSPFVISLRSHPRGSPCPRPCGRLGTWRSWHHSFPPSILWKALISSL